MFPQPPTARLDKCQTNMWVREIDNVLHKQDASLWSRSVVSMIVDLFYIPFRVTGFRTAVVERFSVFFCSIKGLQLVLMC